MVKSFFHIKRHGARRHRRQKEIAAGCRPFLTILGVVAVLASIFCLIELTLYFGFDRTTDESSAIRQMLRIPQAIFTANILAGLLLNFRPSVKNARIFKWIVDIGVLLSVLPWIYPRPDYPWLPFLDKILYGNTFLFGVLAAYSVMELCHAAMRLIGRRTNPALILSASFIIFILVGSFVLMLPRCTYTPISYCDSLFVATSAVCITGLTPVDVPATFTPMGLFVLAMLMQIGGLGVITFTSFFAIFFSGAPSIYSQLLIKDMIYSKSINNLIPTLLYILAFTLVIETAGAFAIYFTIPTGLGMQAHDKIFFAAFHSLSSFCNAGFSCLPGGMANRVLINGNQSIYVVTSILILAGAVGFPILVNFKDIFASWLRRIFRNAPASKARIIHPYDINTKLVLVTTLSILAVGSLGFFILEYNNTLAGMSLSKKMVQSVFNALIPRSAGFTSVNPGLFLPATLMLVVIQMWIGGASQSLAGGIKVNTFATILLNVRAIVRGHASPTAYGRRIAIGSVRRANAVLSLAIGAYIFYSVCLLILQPDISSKSLMFESASALFTVGSSLGATEHLCPLSKIILSTAMFAGRVGILSLMTGFAAGSRDKSPHYPTDSIIIS